MNRRQAALLAKLKQFHADFTRFARMQSEYESREAAARRYGAAREDPPPELEDLRQSLLPRVGALRALVERINGGELIHHVPATGATHRGWDLALFPGSPFSQAFYAKLMADQISTAIGRGAAEPALLEPFKVPRRQAETSQGTGQVINIQGGIHGGVINLAQTREGAVRQRGSTTAEVADVRRLLRELESAIRESGAPADEQEGFVRPVRQLETELDEGRPLMSRLVGAWGAVEKFGAIESSWQGWERVQRIAHELAPRVHDLIQVLANAAPQ